MQSSVQFAASANAKSLVHIVPVTQPGLVFSAPKHIADPYDLKRRADSELRIANDKRWREMHPERWGLKPQRLSPQKQIILGKKANQDDLNKSSNSAAKLPQLVV